jgi:formamidopyrimidine-DNA glycosylase
LPELPEAETIARGLDRAIAGSRIGAVDIRRRRNVVGARQKAFEKSLAGDRIRHVGRRGKYIVMELDSGRLIVVQLRMTGRLLTLPAGKPLPSTSRFVLHLENGCALAFADVRKLGRVHYVGKGETWDQALGLEPLSKGFTVEAFAAMLAGRTTPIKVLLLDQRRIAGVGNIYACEALWVARVHPNLPAKHVTLPAVRRLRRAIVDVLTRAIDGRGSSIDDYVDADGSRGDFQNALRVYGRAGLPCKRCGMPIVRTVLAARGTWWCPHCQQ